MMPVGEDKGRKEKCCLFLPHTLCSQKDLPKLSARPQTLQGDGGAPPQRQRVKIQKLQWTHFEFVVKTQCAVSNSNTTLF